MPSIETWTDLCKIAARKLFSLENHESYAKRLEFECREITKQAARDYWIRIYNEGKKYDHNKYGLVLPFLLGITPIDPIKEQWSYQLQEDGDEKMEVLELTLDNGNIIVIPSNSTILTERGNIKARSLGIGDKIC